MYPDFDSLNNEIIEQTSYDQYNYGLTYRIWFGKMYQQDLHMYAHNVSDPKRSYAKDPNDNIYWEHFRTALHNPPSEKIVDMYRYGISGDGQRQLWALYNEI